MYCRQAGGIAIILSSRNEWDIALKVSPPFEGGVVGKVEYQQYTIFCFPTGVVDSWISSYLYWYENKNLSNRKNLKLFRSSLRNKSTSAEAVLWNILKSKNLN